MKSQSVLVCVQTNSGISINHQLLGYTKCIYFQLNRGAWVRLCCYDRWLLSWCF